MRYGSYLLHRVVHPKLLLADDISITNPTHVNVRLLLTENYHTEVISICAI